MFGSWKTSIVLIACALASGATLQQLSLSDMALQSTAIVHARVGSSSASFTGSTIYTHYRLQVSETWKGTAPAEVMMPGGVAGGYRQSFPGAPQLQPGADYVLFLWTSKTGITYIIGLTQGLFILAPQSDGTTLASRGASGETMLDANGVQVLDRNVQVGLTDLKAQVAQLLGTSAGVLK